MKYVVMINSDEEMITRANAAAGEITPEGISRLFVLEFMESMERSAYLLNAMAAVRAKTIHSRMSPPLLHGITSCIPFKPRKNPMMAKGRAKTVCENLTRER
jgi:hypothetical protein